MTLTTTIYLISLLAGLEIILTILTTIIIVEYFFNYCVSKTLPDYTKADEIRLFTRSRYAILLLIFAGALCIVIPDKSDMYLMLGSSVLSGQFPTDNTELTLNKIYELLHTESGSK